MMAAPFVLSGGGARGFAHLGVLKALEEVQIIPSAIAATSAGSLVGAFIADGFKPEEVKELMLKTIHIGYLFEFRRLGANLVTLNKMGEFMKKNLRHTRIEEMPIPFYPTATNFLDGSQQVFRSGDVVEAALAASSIPAVFEPRMIGQTPYVDGGLCNNLPVEPFEDRKQEVIAVHVNPVAPFDPKSTLARTIDRAFHLSFLHTIRRSAQGCRMFIEPADLHQFGLFDVHKLSEIFEVGYTYTRSFLGANGYTRYS